MCGIWFSSGFSPNSSCIDIVKHRGPDGRGWQTFTSKNSGTITIGHRRLAIIDLTGAPQPMCCSNERYWLTYNGEIYNFRELRAELQSKGCIFKTTSDTEVLLNAFIIWQESCLDHLIGMFAFVVYDRQEERAFAARDRFGIKPLYFSHIDGKLAFSSEIKQILESKIVQATINKTRTYDYLTTGILNHTHETLFDGICQIKAGQAVHINLKDQNSSVLDQVYDWYHLPPPSSIKLDRETAYKKFRDIFETSVQMHMQSDVKIGSCLSGGLDSSAIVSVASRFKEKSAPIETVSAYFEEKRVDERPYIMEVIDATKSNPHYVKPSLHHLFAKIEEITWYQDEPFGSSSILAQWAVFEEASKHGIKVMLDGQGADEQLAGYHICFNHYLYEMITSGHMNNALKTILNRWLKCGLSPFKQLPITSALRIFIKKQKSKSRTRLPIRNDFFPSLGQNYSPLNFANQYNGVKNTNCVMGICLSMLKATSLNMLLHWEDRNSMAHSVESRVPFLDHRLVELNIALGREHKFDGARTKVILREALKEYLPSKIYKRYDKLGFATPEEEWFRALGKDRIMTAVGQTMAQFPNMLDMIEIENYVTDALKSKKTIDFTLWRIINLGVWGKVFNVKA